MEPNQFFLYHDTIHFFISAIIGFLLWRIYKNRWVIVVSILAGIFVDIDHLFDLFANYISIFGWTISPDKVIALFYSNYMDSAGKVFVPFHSIDFLWVWWFVGRGLNSLLRTKGIEWALPLSIFAHILVDYTSYTPNPLAYFLTFRFLNNFSKVRFDTP